MIDAGLGGRPAVPAYRCSSGRGLDFDHLKRFDRAVASACPAQCPLVNHVGVEDGLATSFNSLTS